MSNASPRYVGNLHEKGRPDHNMDSFVLEAAESKESAIGQLTRQAQISMEQQGIAAATLRMTEDGAGIGSVELENPKYAHRA